jgi:hypothetical protein
VDEKHALCGEFHTAVHTRLHPAPSEHMFGTLEVSSDGTGRRGASDPLLEG